MLSNEDISRYSRQLLLPQFGVQGQVALKNAVAVVIGAGGLGCPASIYLAGAGIGELRIVDHDVVELNNLHRQITHSERTLDTPKCESAMAAVNELNSSVKCTAVNLLLTSANVFDVINSSVAVVLDCTDNAASRYLINDACVRRGVPLVSASALRWDGQLTVYNYKSGPCYRCLFPTPPPAETVTNCNEGGVLGVVPGTMGTLQALEAIKIICVIGDPLVGRLLLFDGLSMNFRTIKIRKKRDDCPACGVNPSITDRLVDYLGFCGASGPCDKVKSSVKLEASNRISVQTLSKIISKSEKSRESRDDHGDANSTAMTSRADGVDSGTAGLMIVDVRPEHEFEICHIPGSRNVPYNYIFGTMSVDKFASGLAEIATDVCYLICHRGNDSQEAVLFLQEKFRDDDALKHLTIKDVVGGLEAWSNEIDPNFPKY